MADSCSYGDTHLGSIQGQAALAELTVGGDEVIGTAIDQKLTGEDRSRLSAVGLRYGRKGETTTLRSQNSNQSIWY
jgi:hypothetical protein